MTMDSPLLPNDSSNVWTHGRSEAVVGDIDTIHHQIKDVDDVIDREDLRSATSFNEDKPLITPTKKKQPTNGSFNEHGNKISCCLAENKNTPYSNDDNESSDCNLHPPTDELDGVDGILSIPSKLNKTPSNNADEIVAKNIGSNFGTPDEGLDDVDGAMFSRIPSNLNITPNISADKIRFKDIVSNFGRSDEGLDDVDGAMFSRVSSAMNALPNQNISRQYPMFDDVDGNMFTRPNNQNIARPYSVQILSDAHTKGSKRRHNSSNDIVDAALFNRTPSCSKTNPILNRQFSQSTPQLEQSEVVCEGKSKFYLEPNDDQSSGVLQNNVSGAEVNGEAEDIPKHLVETTLSFDGLDEYNNHVEDQSNGDSDSVVSFTRGSSMKSSVKSKKDGEESTTDIIPSRVEVLKSKNRPKSTSESDISHSRTNSVNRTEVENMPSPDSTLGNNDVQAEQTKFIYDDNERKEREFKLKHLKLIILPVLSMIVFLADIGTDIQLACSYKKDGEFELFYITLGCIIIPSVIMAIVDLSWVVIDHRSTGHKTSCMYYLRIVIGILSLGRIVRAVSHIHHVLKSKREVASTVHKERALDEKRDCFMLDFINAFAESCPQLFVQLYLFYNFSLEFTFFRGASLFSSWISIAWTYASYYRCHRQSVSGRNDIKFIGFVVFFLSVLSALAARVCCIVLFFDYFKHLIGIIVLLLHFVLMLIWIVYQKPELKGLTTSKLGRGLYYLFFAYVSVIYFVNLKETRAKIRMSVFYLLFYIENCVLAALVLWQIITTDIVNSKQWNLLTLPLGFCLHVLLLTIYYKLLHPTTGSCYSSNGDTDGKHTENGETTVNTTPC